MIEIVFGVPGTILKDIENTEWIENQKKELTQSKSQYG